MAPDSSFDSAKAGEFAERLLTTLNDGALCLMISIGHRTGLLDAMRDATPATSVEIAAKAGLHERYVRELLGAIVNAPLGDRRPARNRFFFPIRHAALFPHAAGPDYNRRITQHILH